MRVSVALATYNGASHLREQLASIVGQTMPPAELVVSDDGSTDGTLEIVRAFARTAPFPVMIADKAERLGFSDNFLHAAETCRHELVAFCDQDDVWLPSKLEICVGRIRKDDSLLAMHTLTVTDENLLPTGLHWIQGIIADKAYEPLELDPYMTGWGNSMVLRRDLVRLIDRAKRPRQPERRHLPLSHDTWVYMLAAALGRVSHITAPLILYRQHSANAEGVAMPKRRSRLADIRRVPLARFRERASIDDHMAALLRDVERDAGPYAEAARVAASKLEERSALRSARARMFDGSSVKSRLRAYHTYHHMADPRPRTASRIKSFVLGVAGLRLPKES